MTITHIDKGIDVALLVYKKSSKISPRRSHTAAKGVFKCQEGMWWIQLPAHYSRQAAFTQAKGATSPHSIWTCSEAYGSGPRERAPICSPSWARLAHSQPPHTFGWFINQPFPTIPVHRLIHVWLMYTFACSLERTPGTGGEEGKGLNWSRGGQRMEEEVIPHCHWASTIFRSPGFGRMSFLRNVFYRGPRNLTVT